MSKWLVERKLSEAAERLRQLRTELGVVDEQLAFLTDAADLEEFLVRTVARVDRAR